MTYYSNRMGWLMDGTPTRSIQACETLVEAKKVFHGNLSNYIGTAKSIVCQVIDDDGAVYEQEAWSAPEEDADE